MKIFNSKTNNNNNGYSRLCLQLSRVVLNKKLPSESDIEKYAQDNLNIHKKGIFRKKFSIRDMLSWSKVSYSCVHIILELCSSFSYMCNNNTLPLPPT